MKNDCVRYFTSRWTRGIQAVAWACTNVIQLSTFGYIICNNFMRLIGCVLAPTCRRQTPMPDLSVVVCCSPRAGARALSTTCTDRCPAIRPTFCYIHDRQGTRQNHACTLKCTQLQVHKCMYTQVFLKLHRWDWFWMITIRGSISCIRCEWVIHLCWMIKDYFAARKCRYLLKFVYLLWSNLQ